MSSVSILKHYCHYWCSTNSIWSCIAEKWLAQTGNVSTFVWHNYLVMCPNSSIHALSQLHQTHRWVISRSSHFSLCAWFKFGAELALELLTGWQHWYLSYSFGYTQVMRIAGIISCKPHNSYTCMTLTHKILLHTCITQITRIVLYNWYT